MAEKVFKLRGNSWKGYGYILILSISYRWGTFHVAGCWWCSQTSLVLYALTFSLFFAFLLLCNQESKWHEAFVFSFMYCTFDKTTSISFFFTSARRCYFFRVASPVNFPRDPQTWKDNYWFVLRQCWGMIVYHIAITSFCNPGQDACLKVALICMPSFNIYLYCFHQWCVTIFGPLGKFTQPKNVTRPGWSCEVCECNFLFFFFISFTIFLLFILYKIKYPARFSVYFKLW